MLFNFNRLTGKVLDLLIRQTEANALILVHVHDFNGLTGTAFGAIDHFLHLAAQVAAQHSRLLVQQCLLVNVEFVRVNRTLYDHLAQTVGSGNENNVLEAGFGIHGEHHASSTRLGANHALHTGRQGDQFVVKALMNAVADGAVIKQGGEHLFNRDHDAIYATNVQEGFLLTGERRVRQIFRRCGRAHGHGEVSVTFADLGVCITDSLVQLRLERRINHPLTDFFASFRQRYHIFNVQRRQRFVDLLGQVVVLKEFTEGFSGSSKTARNGDTRRRQIADHFAQGCVLAAYVLNVIFTQVLKPDYIFRQGHLLLRVTGWFVGQSSVGTPCADSAINEWLHKVPDQIEPTFYSKPKQFACPLFQIWPVFKHHVGQPMPPPCLIHEKAILPH